MEWLLIYFLLVNLVTFCIYGFDKWRAIRDGWRIPEKTLLTLALIGGSLGACAGMCVFHHKTKKVKFSVGVPLIIVLQAVLIWALFLRK